MRSRRQVAEIVRTARIAMLKDFVSLNLGFNHTSRESIVDHHTTDISKQLFTDPFSDTVILVLDGTYIFTYKKVRLTSSNALHTQCIKTDP